jgi:uncharacterized protein
MKSMYPKNPTLQADAPTDSAAGLPAAVDGAGTAAPAPKRAAGRRLQVRRSGIHGKGVFALVPFKKAEVVIEYTGEVITWKEALRRHPHDPNDPDHTFYFHVDDEHVIDGKHTGNSAKWINHACAANCEAEEIDGRIFVRALRAIKPGEELNYDYGLVLEGRHTAKVKKQFECRCGSTRCRGTMLAPKR